MKNEPKIMTFVELFDKQPCELFVRIMQSPAIRAFRLYFDVERSGGRKVLAIEDFTVRELDPYESDATELKLSKSAAKCVMNDLWRLGVRPDEDHATSEIAALSRHLEDMRAIAANRLKITLPTRQ